MILLTSRGTAQKPRIIAVFGAGLIGTTVVEYLRHTTSLNLETWPLSWDDSSLQRDHLKALGARIEGILEQHGRQRQANECSVRLLWSAGKAGFHASREQVAGELRSFTAVVRTACEVADRHPEADAGFWLVSSAGGLFEGQRAVDPETRPAPLRPYGDLKLKQENLLRDIAGVIDLRIYRLTSVYGYIWRGMRRGLIPTLVWNGLRHKVTQLSGRLDTLRDYVWIEDLARFLAQDILQRNTTPARQEWVLASTKPSTIYEIKTKVEAILGRRIYLACSSEPINDEDITFSRMAVPPDWNSSDLDSNIRKIHRWVLSSREMARPRL